ncbi:hypothetical protein [Nocardia xishanensis]|uniref:hypothetical protein n=1 Tax=Nocardia xishanensis TaxID=238964 RepID=UPI000B192EF9|nr:hypothetical protein [Nocardia xishanensis]
MRGTVTTLSTLAAAGVALTLGAGAASAIAANPVPDGTRVDLEQAEAGVSGEVTAPPPVGAAVP